MTQVSYAPGRAGRYLAALAAAVVGLLVLQVGNAQAAITGTNDANALGQAITDGSVSGGTLDVAPAANTNGAFPDGTANAPLSGFPTGGNTFTILTSGDVTLADQPNNSESSGAGWGYQNPARGEAFDPTTLGVPVVVPAEDNCISFDYKFLSEEFPEFVNAGFNDAFIAELDATNWSVSSGAIQAPGDFAAPKGDKVSVDNVGPTAVAPVNAAGTTYDAATSVLTTKTAATPGAHTVYLSVFDSGDSIYDSAVFVDNLRFSNEPPQQCQPPDLFAGATGVGLGKSADVQGKNALVPVTCQLDPGITVNCDGTITLLGKLPSRLDYGAKPKKLGKGTYSVPPGQTNDAKVKLSKKALKALARKGSLKVTANVTNSSNGVSSSFKLKLKG